MVVNRTYYAIILYFVSSLVWWLSTAETVRPAWLDQTQRPPPPAQSQEAIDKLISSILSGDNPNNNNFAIGATTVSSSSRQQEDIGPLALANSSRYWSWQDIKPRGSIVDELEAKNFLDDYENDAEKVYSASVEAGWNYFTNLTEFNRKKLVYSDVLLSQFLKLTSLKAQQFDPKRFLNVTVQRVINKLSLEGLNALSEEKFRKLTGIQTEMNQIFANGAVCEEGRPPPCTLQLEPDLSNLMATSTDYSRLYYIWLAWRNSVGPQIRPKYLQLMQLTNEGAALNGFTDAAEMWKNVYETPDLEQIIDDLHSQMKPFFLQLHAYVRRRLMKLYPDYIQRDSPIPAHLLGNMWATSWINLYDASAPFPNKFNLDPTHSLHSQNYTVEKMFHQAEAFYESLGFESLPANFWQNSMFIRPKDRDALCVPAAVDFRNGNDFRVKMCAQVTADDFIRAHHEIGHIYYFMSYKNEPIPFRDGANPAFLDSVASMSALSARTVKYLNDVGLGHFDDSAESDINYLYRIALDRVVFMSFAYVAEKWRWKVASGEFNNTNMEHAWSDLRLRNQGLSPVAERTEKDFDPGSNIQLVQNLPLIQHFIGYILQFQLLQSLCQTAGHTGPLVTCSLHGSKEAGSKLKSLMELGSSRPWPEVLERVTGTRTLNAGPLLEYFQPLREWLEQRNEENKEFIGWNDPRSIIKVLRPENTTEQKLVANDNQITKGIISYPGSSCLQGQRCVEGSVCNGTHCTCPPGMVLWYQLCLPNDPTLVGIGPAGSFDLSLSKGNKTFEKSVDHTVLTKGTGGSESVHSTILLVSLCLILTLYGS